jgi:membrane protein DedA with SNARE-associated domain
MGQLLEQLRAWVEQVISSMGYFGVALLMFLENIFPPIPSEVVMPFAGSLVSEGEFSFVGMMIAGTIGALAGALVIYYIGRWIDEDRARRWINKYGKFLLLSEEEFDKAIDAFNNHGKMMVLVGRVMPTIRSLISLPAGLERMNLIPFLIFTIIGTSIWNLILLGAGYYMGQNWQQVVSFVNTYSLVFYIIIGALIAYYIYKQVRSSSSSDHEEVGSPGS